MDQLDERDRQAFAELQDKLIEHTTKKKQVANQLRSRDNEQKRALLTAEELNSLPHDAKTYEQIGRAYFLVPKQQLVKDCKDSAAQCQADIKTLKDTEAAVQKALQAVDNDFRELLQHSPALQKAIASSS